MKAVVEIAGRQLQIDLDAGQSIAIPLDPHGEQPSFFTDEPASAAPLKSGDFTGQVASGGSCNAEYLRFAPHCHGTHTECVGHILEGGGRVQKMIYPGPVLALLVSLAVEPGGTIERSHLEALLFPAIQNGCEAIVIRTLPNTETKKNRNYNQQPAYPVFSYSGMGWLAGLPLKHLLIDTPSLDAMDNDTLANHRAWWLPEKEPAGDVTATRRSVTEMIYVENTLADGEYWLQLELSPISSDATPSRPILYPLEIKDS